ncbi:MAG: T9SS type A sorting domain-containing protein [Bacteroidota bacterium]|nr:T9SS type A sorting domain-containing protein [Bacteroidota bacterium]
MKKLKILVTFICFAVSTYVFAQPVNGTTTFFTNTTTAILPNTSCTITKTTTLSGWLFSISSTSNCGFNWTSSTGGDGRFQNLVGFGNLTQITFGSDDGSEFALKNLIWGVSTSSWTSKPMSFVGYKNGLPVPGATLNATTPSGTGILNTLVIQFTTNPAFNDVDDIYLAPNSSTCNSILFFEEITVGTASPSCTSPTLNLVGQQNVACNGGSTGSATVSASGGSPYTYTWSPSGGNAASASGLSAGMYTCVVTNSCGSTASRTVNIIQPTSVVGSTAVTNPLCNGSQGSATVAASGGTSPYTYTWSSGPTSSVEPTLLAGTYTVKVIDAYGCNITKSVTITQPPALVTSTAVTNVLCFGATTGAATVTASGGTSSYTYLWSSAQTTSVITSLLAGVRTVTVTDANGCTSTKSITITQPASALSTATAVTNVLCFGNSTGAATVSASGGTSGYSYLWSGAQTTSVISGQTSGIKTVTVTDANGCTKSATVNITQPTSALATATAVTNVLCFGATTGAATVTTSGGTSGYTYLWSSAQTTSVITSLNVGVRTVTVTDGNGCTTTNTVTISQPNALTLTAVANSPTICVGSSSTLTANGSGGTGTINYSWVTGPTNSINVVSPTSNTTYTVNIIDANTCSQSQTVSVATVASPTVSSASGSICAGQSFNINPTGASSYSITGGSSVVSPSSTTSYSVTGSAGGCVSSNTAISSVTVNALPTVSANSGAICFGNSFTIVPSGANTYTISGGGSSVVSPTSNASYNITGTDALGCVSSNTAVSSVTVNILPTVSVNSGVICSGNSFTLTASGSASTYSFSGGSAVVTPSANANYTITGTNSITSCSNTAVSSVTVNALPTIGAVSNSSLLCVGQSASLTASGATTYTWNTGSNATVIAVSPNVNTTYTVNGTDGNGCSNVATITQSVSTCTGIQSIINNEQLSINVYPNPSNGVFTFDLETTSTITIIDLLGKVIYTKELQSGTHDINLSTSKNGIYILKAKSNGTVKTVRLIKE